MSTLARALALMFASLSYCIAVGGDAARADDVSIPEATGSPSITGYLSRPTGAGPFPAVLVLHGCDGFRPLETSTVDELAGLGYVGLAIDTLKPQGLTNACSSTAPAARASVGYAISALAWLRQQSYVEPDRLGVIGFSMGAIAALGVVDPFIAARPPIPGLRAVVAYYPACDGRDGDVTAPLLILNGSADDWIPPATCQAMASKADAAKRPVQIVTYQGATHEFNQPSDHTRIYDGHTLIYDPTATADADARVKAFLARYLK
jgi:dienelactone hydrolase